MVERYLEGLYSECNALPLARQGPVDATRQRQPRLQQVYVDLRTTVGGTLALTYFRLNLSTAQQQMVARLLDGAEGVAEHAQAAGPRGVTNEDLAKVDQALGLEKGTFQQALATPLAVFEAMHFNPQLVLLGDPGGGKSTLTRRLAGMFASRGRPEITPDEQAALANVTQLLGNWLLPIRITLPRWAKELAADATGCADDLIDECVRQFGETAAVPELKLHLAQRLAAQPASLLLLLDGLDEVADGAKRALLLKAVRHFCERFRTVPLIITCRIRPWQAWQKTGDALPLPVFTIDKLDPTAITRFVERWHAELVWAGLYQAADAEFAQRRLLDAIADPTRTDLADMAKTPLLLTMMARVNYERGLPDSRAELYEAYMNQLLWEWERTKHDEKGQPTSLEILLRQGNVDSASLDRKLSQLAYDVHASRGDRDTVDMPRHLLREALEAIHPGQDEARKAAWAVQMLALLDDRTGLLRSLDNGVYQFTHRTFQEYLAARWLATGSSLALKKYKEKIDQEQWGEVIMLALGYQCRVLRQYEDALVILFNLFPKAPQSAAEWRRVLLLGQAYVRLLGPQKAKESEQEEIAATLIERIPPLLTAAMQNLALSPRQRLEAGLLLTRGVNDPLGVGLDEDPPGLDDFVGAPAWGFRIGRYPVTNKQFKRFVEDGGYQNQQWWSEQGLEYKQQYGWTEPRYWKNPTWNRNSQPVVGVSWYEAEAYCAWLTIQLRDNGDIKAEEVVCLPTEQQWMTAAHAEEHVYPWGDEFDPAKANTEESNLNQTTPVHQYKASVTAEGVWDLTGNVWEWSADWNEGKYPYVKGGSYYWDKDDAKSSARDWSDPSDWNVDNGFRCVVVPISRELS